MFLNQKLVGRTVQSVFGILFLQNTTTSSNYCPLFLSYQKKKKVSNKLKMNTFSFIWSHEMTFFFIE